MECRNDIRIAHPNPPNDNVNGNEKDALHIERLIIESNTSARVKDHDDTGSRENQNNNLGKLEAQAQLRARKLD